MMWNWQKNMSNSIMNKYIWCLPISSFTDNFNFKIVYSTGCRNRMCGTNWGSIFWGFSMTCKIISHIKNLNSSWNENAQGNLTVHKPTLRISDSVARTWKVWLNWLMKQHVKLCSYEGALECAYHCHLSKHANRSFSVFYL